MKLNTKKLSEVERGFPILAEGIYFAQIEGDIKDTKNSEDDGTPKKKLVLKCKILNDIVMKKDGSEIPNRNFSLIHTISLTATEKYDPDTAIAQLCDALCPEGEEIPDDVELDWVNDKCCKIQVAINPANKDWPESNRIKKFIQIKAEDNFEMPGF